MRAPVLVSSALCAGMLAVAQVGAARPPTVVTIKHFFRGCHVWSKTERPATTARLRPGDRLVLVDNDPMDFDLAQVAGPRVALRPRLMRSERRTIVFRRRGLYRFVGKNVQTSEELGLQTIGPDNTLRLTVRVE